MEKLNNSSSKNKNDSKMENFTDELKNNAENAKKMEFREQIV
jgi:hypothetical protein